MPTHHNITEVGAETTLYPLETEQPGPCGAAVISTCELFLEVSSLLVVDTPLVTQTQEEFPVQLIGQVELHTPLRRISVQPQILFMLCYISPLRKGQQ